jgi:DNA polymerase-3 subunit delta'
MARAPATLEIETFPEADRLEPFPHPRHTARLVGHEAAERELAASFASGRMHHAWLLTGPVGIGKATLAYRMARHVLAGPEERVPAGADEPLAVPPTAIAARQVAALSHPGLRVIRRAYDPRTKRFPATIGVDEVRRVKELLARTMESGQWRVVLVDAADELNTNAANALLKSLEEPPARTLFLLVVSEPGRLLATIRSRTRTLALSPLGPDALRAAATAAAAPTGDTLPGDADWPRLTRLAEGSPRRLLQLVGGGGLALEDRLQRLVASLPRLDWSEAHSLADELSAPAAETRLAMAHDRLSAIVARLVKVAATGEGDEAEHRLARRLCAEVGPAALASAWSALLAQRTRSEALNLDRKALLLESFAILAQAVGGEGGR